MVVVVMVYSSYNIIEIFLSFYSTFILLRKSDL